VCVLARELPGIGTRVRVWRAIGVTLEGNRRHGDDRARGQSLFQVVVLRLALGQTEALAVVVDHDADMVRVVEGRRTEEAAAILAEVVEHSLSDGFTHSQA
jgi:hypothetical protein